MSQAESDSPALASGQPVHDPGSPRSRATAGYPPAGEEQGEGLARDAAGPEVREITSRSTLHPGETTEDRRRAQALAASIRKHLMEETIPFWERYSVLPDGSGFWPSLARDGTRLGDGAHSVVSIARLTYAFAQVGELSRREEYIAVSLKGARQLRNYYNEQTGAWSWRPASGSSRSDAALRPYGTIFAIYALAVCGRVAGDASLVDLAANSFRALWENAREPTFGGFWHELTSDWKPLLLVHRLDTHLKAIEACSALLAATGNPVWRQYWLELCLLVVGRAYDPGRGCVREQFLPDWSEDVGVTGGQVSYGHNLEAAWFLGHAAIELEEPGLADIGARLLEFVLEEDQRSQAARGRDPSLDARVAGAPGQQGREYSTLSGSRSISGGLFSTGGIPGRGATSAVAPRRSRAVAFSPDVSTLPPAATGGAAAGGAASDLASIEYVWWVQTEAMVALSHYYARCPSRPLLDRLENLWSDISRFFCDPIYGAWFTRVRADGTVTDDRKGGDWKAAYHVVQGCAHTAASLDGTLSPGSGL